MSSTYRHEPLSLSSGEMVKTLALLNRVWPEASTMTMDYLRWLYVDNPFGQAIGMNAYDESGRAVGHYVVIPLAARFRGVKAPVRGALSLHTAVAPEAQGKGLFVELAKATYELAAAHGRQFIVGVANANSTPGFIRRLGFSLEGSLPARVGWLPTTRAKSYEDDFRREWTEEALHWRLRCPGNQYFYDEKKGIYFKKWRGLWNVVMKVAAPPLAEIPRRRLGLPLLFVGQRADFAPAKLTTVSLPDRLRPSPLNLIYRELTPGLPRPTTFGWEAIDFDAF